MDPITVIQSVASLVNLIKGCRTTLRAIEDFKRGDKDLADLARDVESLFAFLQGLEGLLGHHRRALRNSITDDLRKALQPQLQDAVFTVLKLQTELDRIKETGLSAVRRLRWLQAQTELHKLRTRIRDHNLILNSLVLLLFG